MFTIETRSIILNQMILPLKLYTTPLLVLCRQLYRASLIGGFYQK